VGRLGAISEAGRPHVLSAWEFFAFLANSFVFLLIGMEEAVVAIDRLGSLTAGVAILLVMAGRAVAVYSLANLFRDTKLRVSGPYQHVLSWGGLRGALALALALAVPPSVPEGEAIILTAFVVVAFSIFVQGLSMPWLVTDFGLAAQPTASRLPRVRTDPS